MTSHVTYLAQRYLLHELHVQAAAARLANEVERGRGPASRGSGRARPQGDSSPLRHHRPPARTERRSLGA
jgi:hypothetical protein